MKAFSPILTKINTESIPFSKQIAMSKAATTPDLLTFVKLMHPAANINASISHISVYASKGAYQYYNYGTHFKRVDLTTQQSKFYKIS